MRLADRLRFALGTLRGAPTRSALTILAMAIGVAAVVLLTALGEAARHYVVNEFASLGTNLVIVMPGKTETGGAGIALSGTGSPRDLTLADARALQRIPHVSRIAPLVLGAATAAAGGLEREATILGSSAELLAIRHWRLEQGRFLPAGDLERSQPVCVLGSRIRDELFGSRPALGQWVRLGEWRFRVIGVLAPEGRSIGLDVEELVIVPAAAAQSLFNVPGLFRIFVEVSHESRIEAVKAAVTATLKERHQGEEDVTVITQDAVLETFNRIFTALTFTVAGIAAISLAVAGILVMNIMLVAIHQRTAEIGLLKAMGAARRSILGLFLTEAALLSLLGASAGLLLGWGGSRALQAAYPDLLFVAPAWAVLAAVGVALATGILFALLPARQAARLDPVQALARH
jgi:putative ABC transport system permease protein